MTLARTLFRLALGRRPPVTDGELQIPGPAGPVTVRRDKWGVPHIEAETDGDAWFGLGFCHGQDRAFQLETLQRLSRGTLAEMVGPAGLPADRMSRRIGFRRAAVEQLPVLAPDMRAGLEGYAAGVSAGNSHGLTAKPHEFAVLGGEPSPWDAADVLAFLKLQSFFLPSNWDVELARLRTLRADGPDALRALDPVAAGWAVPSPGGEAVLDRLAEDLAAFQQFAPAAGGSNNWAVAGSRTRSGKPLLASDPHLGPMVPPPWYLAHVRTPRWALAGATFAGAPGFPIGHNGFACWGVTAGLTDTTDLVLERPGPWPTVREVIHVKGRPDVVEDVPITPRGPVVSPIFAGPTEAVALRAVWLQPRPLRGFLDVHHAKSFDAFRRAFAEWPVLPLNVVYADAGGTTGRQLVGELPRRGPGAHGLVPLPADAPGNHWDAGFIPFDEMPYEVNPAAGFLATANGPPMVPGSPFVGSDFVDTYREQAIRGELARHAEGWTPADCMKLQLDLRSLPWAEIKDTILAVTSTDAGATAGLDLLRNWNGVVSADSPAAAVFELTVADLSVRVAKAKAPTAWAAMVGGDGAGPLTHNLFGDRRVGHLVRLLRDQPAGWFSRPWADEIADAVAAAVRYLKRHHGPSPDWWHWGDVRPLKLEHPVLGKQRLFRGVFNLGPVPVGGDQNTVSQHGCRPTEPTEPPHNIAGLRAVFDPADWGDCRFVLAGGQSGNPTSRHYDDLFALWRRGDGVPIVWTPDGVLRSAVAALRLTPN
jgi:penicillin amidase